MYIMELKRVIPNIKTFGVLKFSALRREVHIQNEDGTVSEEIKERTYDLKCKQPLLFNEQTLTGTSRQTILF